MMFSLTLSSWNKSTNVRKKLKKKMIGWIQHRRFCLLFFETSAFSFPLGSSLLRKKTTVPVVVPYKYNELPVLPVLVHDKYECQCAESEQNNSSDKTNDNNHHNKDDDSELPKWTKT
jgi:hypothetical protein